MRRDLNLRLNNTLRHISTYSIANLTVLSVLSLWCPGPVWAGGAPSFAPDSLGHAPVCYLPVVLVNTQSTNTSPNLPVRLSLNSSTYSTMEAANLSNINVQDGA